MTDSDDKNPEGPETPNDILTEKALKKHQEEMTTSPTQESASDDDMLKTLTSSPP